MELAPQESVNYHRMALLPGFEILNIHNSPRDWRWYNVEFGVTVLDSWQGEVIHRRRRRTVGPGMIFCATPGEAHSTPRVHRVGSFRVMLIHPNTFRQYLAEHSGRAHRLEWRDIAQNAPRQFLNTHGKICRAIIEGRAESTLSLQTSVVELFESVAANFLENRLPSSSFDVSTRAAVRMRELLHSEDGLQCDLDALARAAGLSRYQALRAFKRQYGLPPHTYQMCLRIERARAALKTGRPVAEVAAKHGFADQSHFGRHFKNIIGVSPGQYIAAHRASAGFF